MANGDLPKQTGATIDAAFKVILTALVGFMGWQQKSMTDEIAAARAERQNDHAEAREEREKLTAWALGVSKQAEKTVTAVNEVRKEVVATKEAVKSLEP